MLWTVRGSIEVGVEVEDPPKRLMCYGIHATRIFSVCRTLMIGLLSLRIAELDNFVAFFL